MIRLSLCMAGLFCKFIVRSCMDIWIQYSSICLRFDSRQINPRWVCSSSLSYNIKGFVIFDNQLVTIWSVMITVASHTQTEIWVISLRCIFYVICNDRFAVTEVQISFPLEKLHPVPAYCSYDCSRGASTICIGHFIDSNQSHGKFSFNSKYTLHLWNSILNSLIPTCILVVYISYR